MNRQGQLDRQLTTAITIIKENPGIDPNDAFRQGAILQNQSSQIDQPILQNDLERIKNLPQKESPPPLSVEDLSNTQIVQQLNSCTNPIYDVVFDAKTGVSKRVIVGCQLPDGRVITKDDVNRVITEANQASQGLQQDIPNIFSSSNLSGLILTLSFVLFLVSPTLLEKVKDTVTDLQKLNELALLSYNLLFGIVAAIVLFELLVCYQKTGTIAGSIVCVFQDVILFSVKIFGEVLKELIRLIPTLFRETANAVVGASTQVASGIAGSILQNIPGTGVTPDTSQAAGSGLIRGFLKGITGN